MDYTPVIREQITREVRQLAQSQPYRPKTVELGYLVNCHKGYPVFGDGESIDGMAVSTSPRADHRFKIVAGSRESCW